MPTFVSKPSLIYGVPPLGKCKTWTMDCGLDRGLNRGLNRGLDHGLKHVCARSEILYPRASQ